jgi:phosphoribosylaminoimidazole-succinocarboxamide synthase
LNVILLTWSSGYIYGYTFPEGLRKNEALPEPIIKPTTKGGVIGYGERLTCAEVVDKGLLEDKTWGPGKETLR